ncbi:40S ribosomal protein S3aE, putative [Babesia ovata]|uniref:40S ribosomal protein S3aE, putative n=1 Tax=Babesia ovata TaxID=189622 RepID=A0A2H6K999_9APIC|nr:40S ribosomal protein S3aE, putative [Babesia ovata]GBE59560.1 40S ribosomal protein S3aE, putative [Babesia ovata]
MPHRDFISRSRPTATSLCCGGVKLLGKQVRGLLRLLNLHAVACVLRDVGVYLHELGEVEFGLLEYLDLPDKDVLQREHSLAGLLDFLANGLRDDLLHNLPQRGSGGLTLHDLDHLASDDSGLRRPDVAGALQLAGAPLGVADAEHPEGVAVSGLDIGVGLNKGVVLPDQRAKLVAGDARAVEVGEAVPALHILTAELDLAVSLVLISVEVGERNIEDTALQTIDGELCKHVNGCLIILRRLPIVSPKDAGAVWSTLQPRTGDLGAHRPSITRINIPPTYLYPGSW